MISLKSIVAVLVVLAAAFVGGYCWGGHDAHKAGRDTAAALQDTISVAFAEIAQLEAHGLRYRRLIDSLEAEREVIPEPVPERPAPVAPTGSASDSAAFWRGAYELEHADNAALRHADSVMRREIRRSDQQLASYASLVAVRDTQLGVALSALKLVRDSLNKALTPPPPRGFRVPLLGIRLCPVVGPGYAQLASGPRGAAIAVTQPLRCGESDRALARAGAHGRPRASR